MATSLSRRSFLQTASGTVGLGLGSALMSGQQSARADSPSSSFLQTLNGWWLQNNLFDPAQLFQFEAVFEEAYVVRASLRASQLVSALDQTALLRGAFAYCDRVVSSQGLQGYPKSLYMGYGLQVSNGMIELSLVADQSAIANAVLEACLFAQDDTAIAGWTQCIEDWAAWVTANFVNYNADGSASVGVGVLNAQWNPINPYWCATALFTTTMFKLARLTDPNQMYSSLGLQGLQWVSSYPYQNATTPLFSSLPACIVLYMMDGLVDGLVYLQDTGQTSLPVYQSALNQFVSLADWLIQNQTSDGRWSTEAAPDPSTSVAPGRDNRCYEAALAWQLLQMNRRLGGAYPQWATCAQSSLAYMGSTAGQTYYGLLCRPFVTGLAWLSFCEASFS
jgi:hypothetical protein